MKSQRVREVKRYRQRETTGEDVGRVKELISTMQRNATNECPFRHRYALFAHST
jgi:hypothetical protein